MTRNLKALGLALLAVLALGAIGAQGASAAHKFKSDGPTLTTGKNVGAVTFQVGEVGTVECKKLTTQTPGGGGGAETETLTVVPKYEECTFGGQPVTVNLHHCYYVFYGETTAGNPTGGEHANSEIKCEGAEQEITVHTVNCTITVPPQLLKHSVRYEREKGLASSTRSITTSHKVKTNKARTTASQPINGCLLFPPNGSEVGKLSGTTTNECFKNERGPVEGTARTTPSPEGEGATTECEVAGAPEV